MAFWSLILIAPLALLLPGQNMARLGDSGLVNFGFIRQVFANDELVKPGLIQTISSLDKWTPDLCYACNLSIVGSTQFPKVHHARISHP